MATTALTLNGQIDGAPQALMHTGIIDDAQLPYFFACFRSFFGQIPVLDANNNPTFKPGLPQTRPNMIMRDMTDTETFERYATWVASDAAGRVQQFMQNQAIAQATAQALSSLQPVTVTQSA